MNRLAVSCDDVFEVLTSGPFPRAVFGKHGGIAPEAPCIVAQDAEIEAHLAACHECRQLAEALRPAVDLIDAAIQELDADLPVYRGSLPAPAFRGSPVVAGTLRGPSASSAPQPRSRAFAAKARSSRPLDGAWRWVAALALGIGLVALFTYADTKSRRSTEGGWPPIAESDDHRPTTEGLAQLSSLGLPIACLLPAGERYSTQQVVARSDSHLGRYACCVGCHTPASRSSVSRTSVSRASASPPSGIVATLASSCLACHDRP